MNLVKKLKSKFIKLIVSFLILMLIFSQIENGLTLNVVFAAQQSFKVDNATFYYDSDSKENCIYFYSGDKSKRIRCPLQTYNGKKVYYPEGYQKNNLLTIYTKDTKTGKYTKSGEYTIDQAYTYMNVDTGTLASFLGTGITPDTVNKKLGLTNSNKKAKSGTTTDKDEDVKDTSKIANDYAKYSYDKDSKELSVTYYDPNESKLVTRTYSFNENTDQFEMNNNEHDQAYYSDFINNDKHNKAHKVQVAIAVKDFEKVTGISSSKLDDYIKSDDDKKKVPIIDKLIDGAAGIILYPAKVIPLLIGKALETAMGIFANDGLNLTLDEILFNKVDILSLDFFNLNSGNSTVDTIRKNVATWYYGIRNIAAVILFVILIYTGLKMALTTIADEKAKYSEMLVDWLIGIALLFLLHYIMQLIIIINNQIVNVFSTALTNSKGDTVNMVDQFFVDAWSGWFTEGVGSALAYVLLVGMTFVFLLAYLKRMITVAFLIVISPLVTVTYSIDKMGDNKSQALNNWFKEFTYNVLIQPFHCGAYLALVESAMKVLNNERSLAAVIVAFVMIVFLYEAEKIIKQIFNFNPQTMSDTVGHAAYYATLMGSAGSLASAGKNKYKSSSEVEPKKETTKTNKSNATSSSSANKETSTSSGNASTRMSPKSNSRINSAISAVTNNRLFQAGVTANKVATKMILGVGLAGATGDPTTMLSAGTNAIKEGMNSGRSYREERNRHELQQSYATAEDEAKQNILDEKVKEKMNVNDLNDLTDEQKLEANKYREQIQQQEGEEIDRQAKEHVRNRANEIAGGSDPQTMAETRLKDSINKLAKSYKNNGMSDKNVNQQLSNDFVNIREGKYKEATHIQMQAKDMKDNVKGKIETLTSPVTDAKRYYRKKKESK